MSEDGARRRWYRGVGPGRWYRRPVVWIGAVLLLAGGLYAADLLRTDDDIPRGTTVAGVELGGLSQDAARARLTSSVVPDLLRPRSATVGTDTLTVDPAALGLSVDLDATLQSVAGQPLNPWTRLRSLFGGGREVTPVLAVDPTGQGSGLDALVAAVDTEPVEGTIRIEGVTAAVVEPVAGRRLDRSGTATAIRDAVEQDAEDLELPVDAVATQLSATAVQEALTGLAEPALSAPVTLTADGFSAELPVAVLAPALRFTPVDGALDMTVDPDSLRRPLTDLLADLREPATDAGFDLQDGRIVVQPAVPGREPDLDALLAALPGTVTGPAPRSLDVPVEATEPDLTTAEAQDLGITEEVSSFTTYFTNSNSGENIRVVAADVDGAVVQPGETFSLNGFTGPRTTAQGYIESTIISGGEFVQAVGGGVSQFATTMFNAVFFAGLEDIYHQPHSYYISRYPAGREATVFYDSIDLAWRNDSPTGIYVQTRWTPGSLTVTFWGTPRYDIESVSGDRYAFTDYEVQRQEDDGDCAAQSGSAGFDVDVTRVFRPVGGGDVLRREVFTTTYNAVPEIRCGPPG